MSNKPRARQLPQFNKIPRSSEEPYRLGSAKFCWRVNRKYVDFDHTEWGWNKLTCRDFFDILVERLHSLEDMTWDDLTKRNHCHSMPVENICEAARVRLLEVCYEMDSLYQIDIGRICRLWGYRDRTVFYLIWHDPRHSVYPTTMKHT